MSRDVVALLCLMVLKVRFVIKIFKYLVNFIGLGTVVETISGCGVGIKIRIEQVESFFIKVKILRRQLSINRRVNMNWESEGKLVAL